MNDPLAQIGKTIQPVLAALRSGKVLDGPLAHALRQRAVDLRWLGAYTSLGTGSADETAPTPARAAGLQEPAHPNPSTKPLEGLPLFIKDNLDVAGMATTAGSSALAGHISPTSCSAVARLIDAGAVVLGKANMHELSFGITSNNAAYGPVRNPYASDRIPGGSSGGTAAAIAAGLAPAGLGSDTGGSLRVPAALCGITGFRPTPGRWPSDGVVKISNTRDTVGPMAHTASDCALLDAVVCNEALDLPLVPLASLRIGVARPLFWENLEAEMAQRAQAVLALLQHAGVTLVECDTGIQDASCVQTGMTLALCEAVPQLKKYLQSHALPFDDDHIARHIAPRIASPDVKGIFTMLLGPDAPSESAYQDALQVQRPALQKQYADCFAQHRLDALIFPTTPLAAARIGEDDTVQLNGQAVPTFLTYTRNVGPGSVAGIPGISLPMGLTQAGLPMGIALDGPVGSDRHLLALAAAVQAVLPAMPSPKLQAP